MPSVQAALAAIAGFVLLCLVLLVWLLSERLENTSLKLEATSAQLAGTVRGLEQLERNAVDAAARAVVVTDTREVIVTAPATADGDLAPVMLDAFRGIDQLGAMR